jgi:hypothetical protein
MTALTTTESTRPPILRVEDVLLAVWNVIGVPLGVALTRGGETDASSPLLGLLQAIAIVGVIVALATRTPDAPPLSTESFRGWALAGPLIGAVALVGDEAGDNLGFDVAILGLVAFGAVVAAFAAADRLPVLPEWQRRVAVAPFILVTSAFFTDFVADLFDGVDVTAIARALFDGSAAASELAAVSGFLVFALVAGSATFYAMLVIAPRELAAPEPLARVWLLRYLLFLGSALLGAAGVVVF